MTERDELLVRGAPLARVVGITGVVGTVLLFGTFIFGSPGEPKLNVTTAEAAKYLRGMDATRVRQLEAVGDIAMFVLLWFMAGLALLLRRVDGDVPGALDNGPAVGRPGHRIRQLRRRRRGKRPPGP